jgi:hypothetical protein
MQVCPEALKAAATYAEDVMNSLRDLCKLLGVEHEEFVKPSGEGSGR